MPEIDLILKHLEDEKRKLNIELQKCLEEADYEGAHHFQQALFSKSNEIMAIRKRIECNFEEIKYLQMKARSVDHSIKRYEKRLLAGMIDERLIKKYKQLLAYSKQELDEYNNKIILLAQTNRAQHIDNDNLLIGIESFLKEEIEILCIEIFEDGLSFISILNKGANIKIELSKGYLREGDRKIHPKAFRKKLNELGFKMNPLLNWNLILTKKNTNRDQIHQIVSTVCFDIIRPTKDPTCNLIIKKK